MAQALEEQHVPKRDIAARFRAGSIVCAILAGTIGLVSLLGWILGNDLLKGAYVADITVKANTAVCLLLAALALTLRSSEPPGLVRTILGHSLAVVVIAVGLATLFEHVFGWDLGIDQLLFQESAGALSTTSPNRMGPIASTCFALVGLALILLDVRKRGGGAPFQILALAVMLVPLVSILGYVYQVHDLYGIAQVTGIALQTAVGLFILGTGLLFARPLAGFMSRIVGEDSGAILRRRLLPSAILLPIVLMSFRILGQEAGLYDLAFGRVLLVLSFMVAFTALVWWTGAIVQRQETATERVRSEIEARLVEADRRKDQFLATLAHELRNPLAPVRNAVEILRREKSGDTETRWAHGVIDRQVDHLTRLIDDLMDVSRISHNKLELRTVRVPLSEVIAGAIESSRPLVEENQHELTVALPDKPLWLDADPIRLTQVFMNLITNAAKYTPSGGTITITAARQGSDVLVRVIDSGIGLAPSHLPHLFEMFFQTKDVLQRTQGGLGIGLALVRHLVQLHGGTVSARSEGLGKGSEFEVRLPLAADQRDTPSRGMDRVASGRVLEGKRVLVVDDNQDAADSLGLLLEMAGAEIRVAHDGEEALVILGEHAFEIALLDIGLPKMSGYDLARALRTQPWGPKAVVVALTGWGQAGDREQSREAGFDHHLVKPVLPQDLIAILENGGSGPSSEEH